MMRLILLLLAFSMFLTASYSFTTSLPIAMKLPEGDDVVMEQIEYGFTRLGIRDMKIEELKHSILSAHHLTNFCPLLLISLFYTEDTQFRANAVSTDRRHFGISQVPWKIPYSSAQIIAGAEVLREKMKLTNGNLEKAIVMYKGWPVGDSKGHQKARQVISLWRDLKDSARRI